MNTYLPSCWPVLLLPGLALAQAPSLGVSVASPIALTAQAGTVVGLTPVPVGPLASFGGQLAQAVAGNDQASAALSWISVADASSAAVSIDAVASVVGNAGASTGDMQILVTLTSPTPLSLELQLSRSLTAVAGATVPPLRIDVGANGSLEMSESDIATEKVVFVVLGPAPVPVLFTLGASAQQGDVMHATLSLFVRPASTRVQQLSGGCTDAQFQVTPRFDGDLGFANLSAHLGPTVAVFGLGQQPVYFGNQVTGGVSLPCLLLPTPDLLVFLPPTAIQVLALPPAVRPVLFRAQSVQLLPTGFGTSTAYQVTAL